MPDTKRYFTTNLLRWNTSVNNRPMPWKGEIDPYKIWLSEIILQQTRVEQGWDYYNRFIKAFPTVMHLAKAPETKVFKLWEGLGYYTRCKNLVATAVFIAGEKNGKFPDTYEEILSLKGVGPYTAAAIGSFAYDLPYAVIDGNVFRVLARYFGITTATDSTEGKKLFTGLANELLDKKHPGVYNQAIMDFGAVCCKPKAPQCNECPLKAKCAAYLKDLVNTLPVKAKRPVKKTRWLYYFVAEYNGKVYVRKRGVKDIWENLYEFILVENKTALTPEKLKRLPALKQLFGNSACQVLAISKEHVQQLTHQTIRGRFIQVHTLQPPGIEGYLPVTKERLKKLPFPRFITGYLAENG
jgi:A/G-specific adenine glycosylase